MMKNKHDKKPLSLRFSPVTLVSTIVGCVFTIHFIMLYSTKVTIDVGVSSHLLIHHPVVREIEQVEEENTHMPPPRKRSPRAIKRKPKRPTTTIAEEFLDENSQIRHLLSPDRKSAFGPSKDGNDTSHYYYPGKIWTDTEGNPIQAHGGGIMYDERSKNYYWYGEYKDGPTYHSHKKAAARVDTVGVGCYSSKDLWTWKNEGVVLSTEETYEKHDNSKVLERPKVIYNSKTKKYVMWMHIDDANYTKASVGVAVSDNPTGPFKYLYSKSPHGFDSRDMTIFKDDDNIAYLIYSSEENTVLHVGPLTENYLDVEPVMKRIMVGQHREAPAVFKHRNTYYMITSDCTGWAPNSALAHAAVSMMGPWETLGNPCVGGNKVFRSKTFFAQGSYVLPVSGVPNAFIFMADRWNAADLKDSRYVWLPLIVGRPANKYSFGFRMSSKVSIYWHKKWKLPSKGGIMKMP